jgi:hypothetical protein
MDVVDELHAPGFVDHDAAGRSPDREGFKAGIAALLGAFPDFEATVVPISRAVPRHAHAT